MKSLIIIRIALIIALSIIWSKINNAQPSEVWVEKYDGKNLSDVPSKMIFDNYGNIIITGRSHVNNSGNPEVRTVKYSTSGQLLFSSFFGLGNYVSVIPAGIAADKDNNLLFTGQWKHYSLSHMIVSKFNAAGNETWTVLYKGDLFPSAAGRSLTTDKSGNIYAAGDYKTIDGEYVICLFKYSHKGEKLWSRFHSDISSTQNRAVSVITDTDGNVYLAGIGDETGSNKNYLIKKYSNSGEEIWTKAIDSDGENEGFESDDMIVCIKADNDGNVFATGSCYGENGRDFFTVKFNGKGIQEWTSKLDLSMLINSSHSDSKIFYDDVPVDMEINTDGDVYITGKSTGSNGGSQIVTEKIRNDGKLLWAKAFDNPDFDYSENAPTDMTMDRFENVFITGYKNGSNLMIDCSSGKDMTTLKYSPDGVLQWEKGFRGSGETGNNDDEAKSVLVNDNNEIFVMGVTSGYNTNEDYCLIKYIEYVKAPVITNNESSYKLFDNFPNPFNPSTKITFEIPQASNVSLTVYDITGKEVASLVNNYLESGKHTYDWNAARLSSGAYFYKLKAGNFVQTKRMYLIK